MMHRRWRIESKKLSERARSGFCTLTWSSGPKEGPRIALAHLALAIALSGASPLACSSDDVAPLPSATGPALDNSLAKPSLGTGGTSGAPSGVRHETAMPPGRFTGEFFDRSRDGWGGAGGASSDEGLGTGDLTVLLILDKSASMTESWGSGTRWDVSMNAFFEGLQGVEDQLTIGTLLFPLGGGECEVLPLNAPNQFQYQSGRSFLAAWRAKSAALYPSGATPLGLAFEHAHAAITAAEQEGLLDAGRRFRVLIVTDGTPNCGTDQDQVIELAAWWKSLGVEIFVIGLPGSHEAAQFLGRLANPVVSTNGGSGYVAPDSGEEAQETFSVAVR